MKQKEHGRDKQSRRLLLESKKSNVVDNHIKTK